VIDLLVVEDDANTRKLLCALLERGGYRTHVAANGLEALDLMEKRRFDLIVLDLMMPGMDGTGYARNCAARGTPFRS